MDSIASTLEPQATSTLLFRVGETTYGCAVAQAQEVLPSRGVTRLPGSPAYVRGLINIRGTIVTVLDLAARLDAAGRAASDSSILLVRHNERLVGVTVDEVTDVRAVSIDEADDSPGAWGTTGSLMRGIAMVDDTSVVILDLESLITQVLHS